MVVEGTADKVLQRLGGSDSQDQWDDGLAGAA